MKTLQALFIAALLGASSLAGAAKGQLNHSIDDGTYFGIDSRNAGLYLPCQVCGRTSVPSGITETTVTISPTMSTVLPEIETLLFASRLDPSLRADYYTPVIGESPTPAWTTTYFAGNAKGQCRLYGIRVWFKNMN
jgi:hypothetical protein